MIGLTPAPRVFSITCITRSRLSPATRFRCASATASPSPAPQRVVALRLPACTSARVVCARKCACTRSRRAGEGLNSADLEGAGRVVLDRGDGGRCALEEDAYGGGEMGMISSDEAGESGWPMVDLSESTAGLATSHNNSSHTRRSELSDSWTWDNMRGVVPEWFLRVDQLTVPVLWSAAAGSSPVSTQTMHDCLSSSLRGSSAPLIRLPNMANDKAAASSPPASSSASDPSAAASPAAGLTIKGLRQERLDALASILKIHRGFLAHAKMPTSGPFFQITDLRAAEATVQRLYGLVKVADELIETLS